MIIIIKKYFIGEFMKKIILFMIALVVMASCLCGCGKSSQTGVTAVKTTTRAVTISDNDFNEIKNVVSKFFKAFSNADYSKMKKISTEDCIKNIFHKKDFFSIEKATLIKIDNDYQLSKNADKVSVGVEFNAEWGGAQKGVYENGTVNYYLILKQVDNNWLIDSITSDSSDVKN